MTDFFDTKKTVYTRSDVASLLGLQENARRKEISEALIRASRYEVNLDIEEAPELEYKEEVWEVRITRSHPKCRIHLRYGARGRWISQYDEVPQEVLQKLRAGRSRQGIIESNRHWKSWEKMKWMSSADRRLRGRSGEIHVLMDIGKVSRPTGRTKCSLIFKALGAPYPELVRAVRVTLPIASQSIRDVIDQIKIANEAQISLK